MNQKNRPVGTILIVDDNPTNLDVLFDHVESLRRRRLELFLATCELGVELVLEVVQSLFHVFSFTREERTEERFDPEAVAPRSFQVQEERDARNSKSAAGVPGRGMTSTSKPVSSSQSASRSMTARLPWSQLASVELTDGVPTNCRSW